ncbi:hypothetical protein KAR91_46570 [Candidatus Pacearchaeota archaeon]|nr:hypothetical protein [Candidatus Pacearchaeota archaeon]
MGAFSNAAFDTSAFSPTAFDFGTPIVISPDCIVAFQGKIKDAAFQGAVIGTVAFQGILIDEAAGFTGLLAGERLLQGPLDPSVGFSGILTDEVGFQGDLCDDD